MKNQDAIKLEAEQKVFHRRYGKCVVREVMLCFGELFGVAITPVEQAGRDLLKLDSGCDIHDFLEDLPRNLSIEKPPVKDGEKPIDHLTAWGAEEITGYQPNEDSEPENINLPTNEDTIE